MRASLVQMRAEARDDLDIDAPLCDGKVDLPTALASARAIYGAQFGRLATLQALTCFDDGTLPRLPDAVKAPLVLAAKTVDLDRLPVIRPWLP